MITNEDFLKALFGEDAPLTHVTDFTYDPLNIPAKEHLRSWSGNYFKDYRFGNFTNQYFTISHFSADETGRARRQKRLYRHTKVVVLDDVKEKLDVNQAKRLPEPSWILETSPGSEQWGYILSEPCSNRSRVENLLDGLVANGLAPDGRDPGMKGVTRYVRLPEGYNTKASKMVNGIPFKCQLTLWQPWMTTTLEALAEPFNVDLNAARREQRVDGAADIEDHPLINIPEVLHIKEVRSAGRFDVTCPWVDEHTDEDDSGAAVFTNKDGSIGFKCHHGACQDRNGGNLLNYIDTATPGFKSRLKNWQLLRDFTQQSEAVSFLDVSTAAPVNFLVPVEPMRAPQVNVSFLDLGQQSVEKTPKVEPMTFLTNDAQPVQPEVIQPEIMEPDALRMMLDQLRRIHPNSDDAKALSKRLLQEADDLDILDRKAMHEEVCDVMNWTKSDFKDILKGFRKQWYEAKAQTVEFYAETVFVKELNQFYDLASGIFYTPEAFQNAWSHQDLEAKKMALQEGQVQKVDKIDFAPGEGRIFVEHGITYANTWQDIIDRGAQGDVDRWRAHFDLLGWGENRKHIEQWMAYTMRHPEHKINHMIILGSAEGCGKDWILFPLAQAMGEFYTGIEGDELLSNYTDYILNTKYLNINETELGDHREAVAISNKLKPLAAAPPNRLRVDQKHVKAIKVRNIASVSMTTNSQLPVRLNGRSRRMYALWSDLRTTDEHDNLLPKWRDYWADRWAWMNGQGAYAGNPGWKAVAHYLMNVVDLSDFDPGVAPPMTEFLRQIKEASKSPMEVTIDEFINNKIGNFQCDVLTIKDMLNTLKAGSMFSENDMYADPKLFTMQRTGMILSKMSSVRKLTIYRHSERMNVWIIRNHDKYDRMSAPDIGEVYKAQMAAVRGSASLKAV